MKKLFNRNASLVQPKEQSKQWILPGEHEPKKAKTMPSVGKVMVIVLWDTQNVIYFDYLKTGKSITAYYFNLLGR